MRLSPKRSGWPGVAVPTRVPLFLGLVASFLAGAVLSFALTGLQSRIGADRATDLWYEADSERVFRNLTERESNHYRTSVHPLTSLLLTTPTIAIAKLGVPRELAAAVTNSAGAGLLSACFFLLCYSVVSRVPDALVFTALLLASSSFIFFTSVFELYSWGAVSILAALLATTVSGTWRFAALVAGSAFSLSMTVTNWMAGLAAAFVRENLQRALLVSAVALGLVAALSAIQVNVYPSAGRFLFLQEEANYVRNDLVSRLVAVPRSFFVDTVVLTGRSQIQDPEQPVVLVQHPAGSMSATGIAATLGWAWLLVVGAIVAWRAASRHAAIRPLAVAVSLVLAGQLALHVIYGESFFLYSLHFVPVLILLASFTALSRWRRLALTVAVVVTILAGWNNVAKFAAARELAAGPLEKLQYASLTERDRLRAAIQRRPRDFWPRGAGHIPIGLPGGSERDKGYLEPGGSFSPGAGSFGVSIWVRSGDGVQTSDTLPAADVHQAFITSGDPDPAVGVSAQTAFYVADWTQQRLGSWRLKVRQLQDSQAIEIALRSAGPAGGPMRTIRDAEGGLWINDRWYVGAAEGLTLVDVGEEGIGGWTSRRESARIVESPQGWAQARFEVAGTGTLTITDTERQPSVPSRLQGIPVRSGVRITGGDAQFKAALDAQVGQMLMGTVGEETRPGDPMNYPLAWLRDGAFVIVALVQAGRLDAARVLVEGMTERDFFGGFGAEADSPGLALWAIGSVSRALKSWAFDQRIWPHVYRKAELIVRMATADAPLNADFSGPVVPLYRKRDLWHVADPPVEGLINGRMDWHRPTVFVSAVSVRGLEEAVRLAYMVGNASAAGRWEGTHTRLEQAVQAAIRRGVERDNDRTLAVGLSPTGVARGIPEFERALHDNWVATRTDDGAFKRTPLWTYFELAKARQWLLLDRADRTWATLRWFWERSPAAGLYTLWEGDGEANSFGLWSSVRGWAEPRHVTPHYWASAEMVLTQIAALALVDGDTLVVGAGVPAEWLNHPLSVDGIVTDIGPVSWKWDGSSLAVTMPCGDRVPVRAGHAFVARAVSINQSGCSERGSHDAFRAAEESFQEKGQ